jgi:hypothetical protein
MSNDLVVALGAKLDQFAADMNQAGDIADSTVSKIESSFAGLNPGVNFSTLGTAIVAGGVAVSGLIALVAALNNSLSDMAKTAERVGLSFGRFQQLKFGAAAIGIDDKDFNSSLDSFASKLNDSKSKANDLTRVFVANGVALTDANGKLKDTNELLTKAFDIIKRAPSIQDALQIGGFLGISKQASQAIFDAGDNFLRLASQANAAGAVIDDATINKAKEFTTEWNKASALWGANMRAALGEFLPLLNEAVNGATKLIGYVGQVFTALSAIKEFAIPTDIDTAPLDKLNKRYEDIFAIREKLADNSTRKADFLGTEVDVQTKPLNPIELFQVAGLEENGKLTVEALDKYLALLSDRILNFNKGVRVEIRTNPTPSVNPGIKPVEEQRDQFEIGVDQITKRTATVKADTAAVFENSAVQAQLRGEFQLLNAIMRDEGEVTQAQIDAYEKLRTSMSATQALQAAGIELTKEHRSQFLLTTQTLGAATGAYDKAKDSLQKINSASSQIGSALSTAFADAVVEGKNLNDVFSSLIKTLEKAAINSVFASFFNPGAGGGLSAFSNLLGVGSIGKNAEGTDNWSGGPTWVGEKGPEIVNLPRGAQVVPNAVAARSGGGGVTVAPVYNIDATGADAAAVNRLQQSLVALHSSIERRAVAAVAQQQMRYG